MKMSASAEPHASRRSNDTCTYVFIRNLRSHPLHMHLSPLLHPDIRIMPPLETFGLLLLPLPLFASGIEASNTVDRNDVDKRAIPSASCWGQSDQRSASLPDRTHRLPIQTVSHSLFWLHWRKLDCVLLVWLPTCWTSAIEVFLDVVPAEETDLGTAKPICESASTAANGLSA